MNVLTAARIKKDDEYDRKILPCKQSISWLSDGEN